MWSRVLLRACLGRRASLVRTSRAVLVPMSKDQACRFDCRPDGESPTGNLRHRDKDPSPSRNDHVELMVSDRGGLMRRRTGAALLGAALACVALPAAAFADTLDAASSGNLADSVAINSIWVVVAAILVMFMQAGFAFLEIGFSRGKNAGTVVAKILVNFSIAAILLLGRRLRVRVRRRRPSSARTASSCRDYGDPAEGLPGSWACRTPRSRRKFLFQFVVLRRLARDRLGHDARADQVRRLHHLRDRLRGADLPDRARTGSSAAAGCSPTSACRTSPARPRST